MIKTLSLIILLAATHSFASDSSNHWVVCRNKNAQGSSIPFSGTIKNFKFRPECAPDVLYSWQNFKSKDFENFKNHPFSGYSQLFTWRTPLGTFGYGTTQIRIKLKKDIQFKWIEHKDSGCSKMLPIEKSNTVYVFNPAPRGGMVDYLLCSPEVVESWSKNTIGASLETHKEYEFIKKANEEQRKNKWGQAIKLSYDSYGLFDKNRRRIYPTFTADNPYFEPIFDEGTNWYMSHMNANLERIGQQIDPYDGVVFFNKNVEQDLKIHFSSMVNSYFQLNSNEIETAVGVNL